MILEAIFTIVITLVNFIFSLIPDVPDVPPAFISTADSLIDVLQKGSSVIKDFLGATFFDAVLVVASIGIVFFITYSIYMWIWKKVPISSH